MTRLAKWIRILSLVAVAMASAMFPGKAAAQQAAADTIYQVRLTDGTTVVGRMESRTADRIVIVTLAGVRVELLATQAKEVTPIAGRVVDGVYWPQDPNPSRLFFAPTARSVGQGSGYAGVFQVLLPFVAYGVTDRVTLAGGVPILIGVFDVFYLAPKIEVVRAPSTSVSLGVLSFFAPQTTRSLESAGIAYAVGTFGSRDHAVSTAVGYGYAGDEVAGQPAFMLGGETRVSRRMKLITENYFVAGDAGGFMSGGLRLLGERMTGDIGMMGVYGGGENFCCFPVINISYAIGKQR